MPLFRRRRQAPDLAGLRRECRDFIAQLELSEPDEDWIPSALYYGKKGPAMAAFQLDAAEVTHALDELLDEQEATACGFWATTWMVRADDVAEAPGVRASEHPRRFEALVLNLQAEGRYALDFAPNERHRDRPPTLGMWETFEEG